jgi:F0F1-type ATP synthase, epsilon subunit (mitochondrial delta subunit)
MADKIQLEIVTPERRLLDEPVDMVTVPGLNGELGILPGHTPLISQLKTGVLTYVQDGKNSQLHVSWWLYRSTRRSRICSRSDSGAARGD